MKKALLILFIGISFGVFAQHPCKSLSAIINLPPEFNCAGDIMQLSVSVHGTGPFSYLWEPSGATTSSITVVLDSTETFSVTVKDSCRDSAKSIAPINVDNPKVTLPPIMYIALGDSIIIVAKGNGFAYQWAPGQLYGRCLNPPLCDSIKVSPPANIVYTVTTTDSLGCQASAVDTIIVGAAGVLSFSAVKLMSVYPNPSSTEFTINLQNNALLQVSDITGRVLFSEMENAGNVRFGKELNPGIYFLLIDGKPVGKIVKQ